MHIYQRVLLVTLLGLSLGSLSVSRGELTLIETTGIGPNREAAIHDAQRRAVETSVGMVIGAESFVRNYELVANLVHSHTSGYVRLYEILSEGPSGMNDYQVELKVAVEPVIDGLVTDTLARNLLLRWMRIPIVQLDILEVNNGDTSSAAAATIIHDRLSEHGFRVIDSGMTGVEPDLLLTGRIVAREGTTPEVLTRAGMVSVQADADISLVMADTREVLVSRRRQAASPHIDPTAGGSRAISEAVRPLVDILVSDVVRLWALQRVNTLPLTLYFEGANQQEADLLIERVASLPGVRAAYRKNLSPLGLTCYSEVEGTSDVIARRLQEQFATAGGEWEVIRTSWGRIDLVRAR